MSLIPRKRSILFSPHNPNLFLVATNDLKLYKLISSQDDPEKAYVHLVASTEHPSMKCFSWSFNPQTPDVIVLGSTMGKAILTKLPGSDTSEENEAFQVEFKPKQARSCNVIGFNPVVHTQFFTGLDKVRNDNCLQIWDINAYTARVPDGLGKIRRPKLPVEDPYRAFSPGEPVSSASWFPTNPFLLAAGITKYIRLYDIRADSNSPISTITTKSTLGISNDPFHEFRFASFSDEGEIKVWDTRKLSNGPVVTIASGSKVLNEIAWSTQRPNLLASISKDEDFVSFWELQNQAPSMTEGDRSKEFDLWKSSQSQNSLFPLSTMAWHPTLDNQLIALNKNDTFVHLKVPISVNICWSPSGAISATSGDTIVIYGHPNEREPSLAVPSAESTSIFLSPAAGGFLPDQARPATSFEDISVTMRERARNNYTVDIATNMIHPALVNNLALYELWSYLFRCQSLAQSNQAAPQTSTPASAGSSQLAPKGQESPFTGVYGIICGKGTDKDFVALNSQKITQSVPGQLSLATYRSPQRKAALQLCGWGFDNPRNDLSSQLTSLEIGGYCERAAALALFHLDIRRAIKALNSGQSEQLKLVSLALAGYSENQLANPLWKETVASLSSQFQHPYLRAVFVFLTSSNLSLILENEGLSLSDRVGFACRFLDDRELVTYIKNLTEKFTIKGDIEGILLTGLTKEGVQLFEGYVDRTGDVQTPTLVLSHVIPREFKDKRSEKWLDIYRDLLDIWQLWNERAQFDIARQKLNTEEKPPVQVFARCNFCGTSLSYSAATMAPNTTARKMPLGSGAPPGSQTKPTVCSNPTCKKPMPRCALCLLHLGTPPPTLPEPGNETEGAPVVKKPTGIDSWFTWCQTCRHGGHVVHLEEWFKTHRVCPVADCQCRCMDQDSWALRGE